MRFKSLLVGAALSLSFSAQAFTAADAEPYKNTLSELLGKAQIKLTDAEAADYQSAISKAIADKSLAIDKDQFLFLVNRHPKAQMSAVYLVSPNGSSTLLGASKVSTGTSGRKEYFFTPTGVFENKTEYGNYRAEGTKNENGIRGYGKKGMRVFDLGWQDSHAGWGTQWPAKIRLQVHATDPDFLEQRLGQPASKGCIRVHQHLNTFIDQYGVLDADYEAKNLKWPLSKEKKQTPYSGRFVFILDRAPDAPKASGN